MKSIFVSIASYRDPELESTIKSAIDNAHDKSRLHFGIVAQGLKSENPKLEWLGNKKVVEIHPKDARGAGYARSLAMELYDDEEYFLQIDSHIQFTKNWDLELIKQLEMAQQKGNRNVMISAFPGMYIRENNKPFIIPFQKNNNMTFATKQKLFKRKTGEWASERVLFDNPDDPTPEQSTTVLAGFIFAPGRLVKELPYDPEISFFGEEVCFAVRAWTRGWDIYSPKHFILYHFYGRSGYKKIWKDNNVRPISWQELEEISKNKQKNVLCGLIRGDFGLGKVRNVKEYQDLTGYDFKREYGLTNAWD